MRRGIVRAAAGVVLAALSAPAAQAQPAVDPCSLMTGDEFAALAGRPAFGEPEAMALGAGAVCGYDGGQIVLFSGATAWQDWERVMQAFGQQDAARTPVPELGEDAYALLVEPANAYQSPAAFVVFGAGPHAVAVSVDGEDGQPPEAALPNAVGVAEAVAAKLR